MFWRRESGCRILRIRRTHNSIVVWSAVGVFTCIVKECLQTQLPENRLLRSIQDGSVRINVNRLQNVRLMQESLCLTAAEQWAWHYSTPTKFYVGNAVDALSKVEKKTAWHQGEFHRTRDILLIDFSVRNSLRHHAPNCFDSPCSCRCIFTICS